VKFDASQSRTYERSGIATGYLTSLQVDDSFHFTKRTLQNFTLKKDYLNEPVIMICHGTGIAPFMSFLRYKKQNSDNLNSSNWWLIYGCRHPTKDFLYKNEILENFAAHHSILEKFHVTFSRFVLDDPKSDLISYYVNETKYVQDIVKAKSKDLCDLVVNRNAVVYVCGDENSMTKDVFNCFVESIRQEYGDRIDDAQKYVLEMMNTKRYKQDIWN
jgi:sulfite reductase alpha subunit-like flavoprotein